MGRRDRSDNENKSVPISPLRDVSAVQQHVTIHEMLHMVPQLRAWELSDAARQEHQQSFKHAVEQLLGPAPW
jgi:hypothetical protein